MQPNGGQPNPDYLGQMLSGVPIQNQMSPQQLQMYTNMQSSSNTQSGRSSQDDPDPVMPHESNRVCTIPCAQSGQYCDNRIECCPNGDTSSFGPMCINNRCKGSGCAKGGENCWQDPKRPLPCCNEQHVCGPPDPNTKIAVCKHPAVYAWCADEGDLCNCAGTVRFGGGSSWYTKQSSDSISCSSNVFGDPLPGSQKHCECSAN